jgi:hypothetical protein
MKFISLVPYYFVWHYTLAIKNVLDICANFIWFTWNFFSFKILILTLFSPYKRLTERYNGGLDLEQLMEALVINTLMRFIGFIARTFVLITGLVAMVLVLLFASLAILIWLALPFVLILFFVAGSISIVFNKALI